MVREVVSPYLFVCFLFPSSYSVLFSYCSFVQLHRRALLKHVLAPTSAQQEEELAAKRRRQEKEKKTEESKKTLLEKHAELKEKDAGWFWMSVNRVQQ